MQIERRQSKRFRVTRVVPVSFTCSGALMGGRLYDISERGIAIEYEGAKCTAPDEALDITIFKASADRPNVGNITCVPVYDIATLAHGVSFSGKEMRICGMACANSEARPQETSEIMKDLMLSDSVEI